VIFFCDSIFISIHGNLGKKTQNLKTPLKKQERLTPFSLTPHPHTPAPMGTSQSSRVIQTAQFKVMCEKFKNSPRNGEEGSNEVETFTVTSLRSGSILASNRILKCDLFPSGRDKSLPVQIDDAPNFRQVRRRLYPHPSNLQKRDTPSRSFCRASLALTRSPPPLLIPNMIHILISCGTVPSLESNFWQRAACHQGPEACARVPRRSARVRS
jgi:hypothetical protein